jgi:hypothetical protein
MTWITSSQSRFSNAQSIHRAAASVAYPFPHADRSRAHPTSVPGHPSGCHGPTRPIQRPVAFSMTEKLLKPLTIQAPVKMQMFRQAAGRHCGPPRKREATGSPTILAQGSKSSGRGGLNCNRSVSRIGPTMSFLSGQLFGRRRTSAAVQCPTAAIRIVATRRYLTQRRLSTSEARGSGVEGDRSDHLSEIAADPSRTFGYFATKLSIEFLGRACTCVAISSG